MQNLLKNILVNSKEKIKIITKKILKYDKNYLLGENSSLSKNAIIINTKSANLINIGKSSFILGTLQIFDNGGKITIGDESFIGKDTLISSWESITIGNRVLISHNVNIFDSRSHPISAVIRNKHFRELLIEGNAKKTDLNCSPVLIEDDVWIGCMCIIHKGVTIGKGSIISAGSVVTKNVKEYTVVAGNPAIIIENLKINDK